MPSTALPGGALTEWSLQVQNADLAGLGSTRIDGFPFRVGRRPGLEMTIPSAKVSGLHAELYVEQGHLWVRDCNSTNGTFAGGTRVTDVKRLADNETLQIADIVFRVRREKQQSGMATLSGSQLHDTLMLVEFEQLMSGRKVVPHFQPICRHDGSIVAFEALARGDTDLLRSPKDLFDAAAKLRQSCELSRMLRDVSMEHGCQLGDVPIFLNTHPDEVTHHRDFQRSLESLRRAYPDQTIVIELHETAVAHMVAMQEICDVLRDLDLEFAYDDFGTGQSRLLELVEFPPKYMKFDMSLVRDIDRCSPRRRLVVGALVQMVRDLGIVALAEGVETAGEVQVCHDFGVELYQGYHFGRPAPRQHWTG